MICFRQKRTRRCSIRCEPERNRAEFEMAACGRGNGFDDEHRFVHDAKLETDYQPGSKQGRCFQCQRSDGRQSAVLPIAVELSFGFPNLSPLGPFNAAASSADDPRGGFDDIPAVVNPSGSEIQFR